MQMWKEFREFIMRGNVMDLAVGIIIGTAFAGAWTLLIGSLALMGDGGPLRAAAAGNPWVVYPLNPAPDMAWLPWAWVALGAFGTLVQMRWTGGERGRVVKANKKRPPKEA